MFIKIKRTLISFRKRLFRRGRRPRVLKVMLHETIRNDDFKLNKALQHCFEWLQHCCNIAALCSTKNGRCESSRVTSPQTGLHSFS